MTLVMSSKKKKSEICENCSELEFDMWDGQFEFVGNAYEASPTAADDIDTLKLPKISRYPHSVQKVILSRRFVDNLLLFSTILIYIVIFYH